MENLGFDWISVRRLGVMGGTFDPIHHGHLVVAEQVRQVCGLDRILFIPSGHPPHKRTSSISSGKDRYLMSVLATCDEPSFSVSQIELMRRETSYTIETLRLLQSWTGPECQLHFIAGADMALDLPNWREPDAVLDNCRFLAVARPGYDLDALGTLLGEQRAAKMEKLALDTPDISATEIRRRVTQGLPTTGLTPEPVMLYIQAAGLYVTNCPSRPACTA